MTTAVLPTVALAQMEVLPGRPDLNVRRMLELIERGREAGAEVVAFSEMCVAGYILGDLWEIDALVNDFATWSETIREASAGMTVLFGNVVVDARHIGEDGRARKYNAAIVCHDRQYLDRPGLPPGLPPGIQPKTLHPNYRFFDDDRHFYSLRKLADSEGRDVYEWMLPFEVPTSGGQMFRFGAQLCEDIWCQDYTHRGETLDGVRAFHARGSHAVFNLSASPWTWQKNDKRNRTIRDVLSTSPLPFFYVNHVGAQNNGKNILVFDGDTCGYSPDGRISFRAPGWKETLAVLPGPSPIPQVVAGEVESTYQALLTGLAHLDHIRGTDNRFLIGISGGIDSSVVACLLVQTFGSKRVLAVNMPTQFNSEITALNARTLCENLDVDYLSCPIQELYQRVASIVRGSTFSSSDGEYSRLVDENIQARIRGADILAGLAAKHGLVFSNNGNKTEVALGYATLYGDVNGAVAPIADLYKPQVFALARYLNETVFGREVIPVNLYDGSTVPSAELSAEQDVTKGLGDPIKYGYHDAVLRALIEYRRHPMDLMQWYLDGELLDRLEWPDPERFCRYFQSGEAWVSDLEWIERQMRTNLFKRIQAPPIIVVSKRSFGFDLRESQMPRYLPKNYHALRSTVAATKISCAEAGQGGAMRAWVTSARPISQDND